jgi:hypothetical protein
MEIKKYLKANLSIYLTYLLVKKRWYNLLYDDRDFLRKKYRHTYGCCPKIENPKTFYEKLIWSMLNHRNELYIKCADKYEVRNYVKIKVGEEYLLKNYAIYYKAEEIKLNELPESFVLKATHASGWVLICANKSELDIKKTLRLVRFWLLNNYYNFDREWHYNYMPKRVVCEEYIGDKNGTPPMDYKIYCFSGEPKLIQLDIDRFTDHKRNLYDIEWNLVKEKKPLRVPDFSKKYEKPRNFNKMLEIARKLSKDFKHVRIDLYNLDGKIFFGEMTFFCGGGTEFFASEEIHKLVGSWFDLPEANISSLIMKN